MRQAKWVVLGVSSFIFIIGLGWSMHGAFLVLPFAGIDIALFAYFMFKVCDANYQKEVITIDRNRVLIQSGKSEIEQTIDLDRPATYVVVAEPEIPTKPIGLRLSDSKSHFELGTFLNQSDKLETRKALNEAGLTEVNEKWWHPLS
jgi:uncharacterized membrane protein